MAEMPAVGRGFIAELDMPAIDEPGWTHAPPAGERRVAVVSSAAVSKRGEKPFSWLARDYRVIGVDDRDLVMTHVAVEYDRTAWQQDINTILPFDRLEEMADDREIGSVASEHYAFMGASDPRDMERSANEVIKRMRRDNVNTVFLIPV
jgi:D-proline reductase (dithiol) PrdB